MQRAETERVLAYAGLSANESKVYLSLLKLGKAASGILTQDSGVHRRNVYDALERLLQKGLAGFVLEGKRKVYRPESPERLLAIVRTRESELSSVIPKLKAVYGAQREPYEAQFYIGKRGLKAVMDDQLAVGKDIRIFGSHSRVEERLRHYFPQFERSRIKKGIHIRMVVDETSREAAAVRLPLVSAKFLPKGFSSPMSTNIYGDRIAIINWSEPVLITLIKNQKLADSYRKFYGLLWAAAKP
ncbi:MAG: helix-turn-helix domain-containing protein [Candidatus Aenigmatarchaeota archaeon]